MNAYKVEKKQHQKAHHEHTTSSMTSPKKMELYSSKILLMTVFVMMNLLPI